VSVPELEAAYGAAKRAYRSAGRAAKGRPNGAAEQVAYEAARNEYHRAGEALRRERAARRR
jgi:hypothetical protein